MHIVHCEVCFLALQRIMSLKEQLHVQKGLNLLFLTKQIAFHKLHDNDQNTWKLKNNTEKLHVLIIYEQ